VFAPIEVLVHSLFQPRRDAKWKYGIDPNGAGLRAQPTVQGADTHLKSEPWANGVSLWSIQARPCVCQRYCVLTWLADQIYRTHRLPNWLAGA
jgi:hypothetical protein